MCVCVRARGVSIVGSLGNARTHVAARPLAPRHAVVPAARDKRPRAARGTAVRTPPAACRDVRRDEMIRPAVVLVLVLLLLLPTAST